MIVYPYKIDECGFYQRGSTEPSFGYLIEFLPEFIEWINKKELIVETATYQDNESQTPRTFCFEAFQIPHSDSYGFVFWNETPQFDEGIASVPLSSEVGNVKVDINEGNEDSISGWPVYIIIDPNLSLLVSLVPDVFRGSRRSGIPQIRRYFREYLKMKSNYAIKQGLVNGIENTTEEIIGWGIEGSNYSKNYSIRFNTKELRTKGKLARIIEKYNKIYKLVMSSEINFEIPTERSIFERAIALIFPDSLEGKSMDKANYRAEIDFNPTKNDMNKLIEHWGKEVDRGNESYEIGVRFSGESNRVYWFSQARGVFEHEIDDEIKNKSLWNSSELIAIWREIRNSVLKIYKGAL